MRAIAAGAALTVLLAMPIAGLVGQGLTPGEMLVAAAVGWAQARGAVGWVLLPQLVLAIGVVGLLLHKIVSGMAGWGGFASPRWLEPAVESALLLGMLGTISGLVRGFAGMAPEDIEPGPLLHALGTALRSSFLGFGIALIGVWIRDDGTELPAGAVT